MDKIKVKADTIRLQNLSYAHKQSGTFRAAIELDLFTAISRGASQLPDIQKALGLNSLNEKLGSNLQ